MFRVITDLLRRHRIGYPPLESEPEVPGPGAAVPERVQLTPEEETRRRQRLLAQEAYIRLLEVEAGLLVRQDAARQDERSGGEGG